MVVAGSGADIRYYSDEVCRYPSFEMVVGGTDRDAPYIGGEPAWYLSDRNPIDQSYDRFIYVGKDNFIREKPIGIYNSKWVACLRIPSNLVKGYVVVPTTYTKEGNEVTVKLGACDFTERYEEYNQGLKRNFFTRPCSWSLTTIGGFQNIGIITRQNLSFLSNLKSSISSVSLDLYSNDGGLLLG